MSNMFILIYSGGGGRDVYKNVMGAQAIKVWDPLY
jgi:hypothetical protein